MVVVGVQYSSSWVQGVAVVLVASINATASITAATTAAATAPTILLLQLAFSPLLL